MRACSKQYRLKKVLMAKAKTKPSIKFYEVFDWLFSNQEMPEKFKMNPNALNGIVPYITEQFWVIPQLTSYLNKHINDLHVIPDPIETLMLLKKIIINRRLTKTKCWNFRIDFAGSQRQAKLLQELQDRDQLDDGNSRAKRMLMSKLGIDSSQYFKVAPTKKNIDLNNNVSKIIIKDAIANKRHQDKIKKEEARVNDSRFLKDLNQGIIDDLELIIFDVSLLKKVNKILFTFIDRDNLKRYYMVPFAAEVYLSKKNGVINNDYIEDLNDEDFTKYLIKDFKLYNRLKYMLNKSYSRTLNLPSFKGEIL